MNFITDSSIYIQASYDLRPISLRCDPSDDTSQCFLSIDRVTGELNYAVKTNFTVYKTGNGSNEKKVISWIEGEREHCNHPENNYLFGYVDFTTSSLSLIACIPTSITIDMDEWIASFSTDNSLFATGSGDAESGKLQLLIFNTMTGKVQVNSQLKGLTEELGAAENLIWIWGIDFYNPSSSSSSSSASSSS